jgi:hypothetical protein
MAHLSERTRRRAAMVLWVMAWGLFVLVVATGQGLPNLGMVFGPLVWVILLLLEMRGKEPIRRTLARVGPFLVALYGGIALGVVLGGGPLADAQDRPPFWLVGAAVIASIAAAALWPSQPEPELLRRRSLGWPAPAAILCGIAAMFVVTNDGPGPVMALVLLVIAVILGVWAVVAGAKGDER